MMNLVHDFRSQLSLKEMDPSLLADTIVHEFPDPSAEQTLRGAIAFASYVHRNDTRAQRGPLPRDPYITHPLRVAVRLIRYGVTDLDIILAGILHDTVEDHPTEIAEKFGPNLGVDTAIDVVARMFGAETARLVAAVTNPPMPQGATRARKHELYREHVADTITDPKVAMVKLSDFVDNAFSLGYTVGQRPQMVLNLATKYTPLVDVFETRVFQDDVLALVNHPEKIRAHIDHGKVTLAQVAHDAAEAESAGR
ncbi:HD domain-containing protein [Agromyces sp. NPDC057679]|uniref:HD domain-containing protein n=1 Tax=Agromyces sp. NPDC057679 TaxID=3346207 RepID=UPI00366B9DAD